MYIYINLTENKYFFNENYLNYGQTSLPTTGLKDQ